MAWQLRRGGPQETDPAYPRAVWGELGPGVSKGHSQADLKGARGLL